MISQVLASNFFFFVNFFVLSASPICWPSLHYKLHTLVFLIWYIINGIFFGICDRLCENQSYGSKYNLEIWSNPTGILNTLALPQLVSSDESLPVRKTVHVCIVVSKTVHYIYVMYLTFHYIISNCMCTQLWNLPVGTLSTPISLYFRHVLYEGYASLEINHALMNRQLLSQIVVTFKIYYKLF